MYSVGNQECIIKMESVNEWVVDIENKVEKMEDVPKDLELNKKRCIYKIPNYIRELDKEAYTPQVVSLGPYHHNDNPNLEAMEKHKERALLYFLKKTGIPLTQLFEALKKEVNNLKEAFENPGSLRDDEEFVQMMILDGCFILEILQTDSIFSGHGSYLTEMPLISRDMLLIENQVPLRVLEILVRIGRGEDEHADVKHVVINSILTFFGLDRQLESMDQPGCLHVLDVVRSGLLVEHPRYEEKGKPFESEYVFRPLIIPSATDLHQAGIEFLPSSKGITFKDSTLHVRQIVAVMDDTKSFYLNLMAFERMHAAAGNEVTSDVYFMGCLIKNDRDASLLRSVGIVRALGSDEDVAQLFRSISKYAMLNPAYSALVIDFQFMTRKVSERCRMKLSAWRKDLLKNYLKSPWGVVSVIAAIILFTLTTIQTVFTVLDYTNTR